MKPTTIGIVFLVCGVLATAIPLEKDNKPETKHLEIKPMTASEEEANKEALETSNNFGIGYYPMPYDGLYGVNRPGLIGYRSGYGSYDAQWSQYSRYNAYRGYRLYDGYYGRPVYPVWG